MITPTQQIVWSIVSRQPIADLSPTSRQPVADQSQPISNQLAINRPSVADRSPIFKDSCHRPVADWSATEKMVAVVAVVALVAAVFSRKAVADRLQYMCDRVFRYTRVKVLTHWGRDKIDAISQTTFSSAFPWMKMFEFRLKFHWSLFLRVHLTIFQHWFG